MISFKMNGHIKYKIIEFMLNIIKMLNFQSCCNKMVNLKEFQIVQKFIRLDTN